MTSTTAAARLAAALTFGLMALSPGLGHAADITVREIASAIHAAANAQPVIFTSRDMSGLDLAGLNFQAATLDKVNLNGADLTGTNLSGADLTEASLDRTTLIKTDLRGAKLSGARMTMPAVSTTFDIDATDAPNFAGADLSHARILVRF
jgi:uncharacterized protein YjbI with pentapeptide repeats